MKRVRVDVQRGCSVGVSERLTRIIFSQILSLTFETHRTKSRLGHIKVDIEIGNIAHSIVSYSLVTYY